MKIYISNVYGMISDKRIAQNQQRIASVGKNLGCFELGIYNYPAENEPEREQSKRLDGILAAVQRDDIVVVQFPTGNGAWFDERLCTKINERHAQLIMLWHSMRYYLEHNTNLAIWSDYEIPVNAVCEALSYKEDFMIQKLLIDAWQNKKESGASNADMIHIGMGVHDKDGNYCSWLGITMQSIMEHTSATIDFHILHDETLTLVNKRRLMYLALRSHHKIEFHRIDESCFRSQNAQMGMYTIGALFRILLPEICTDLSRIIYLDSDLLVHCDISELWNTDISDYCLAAVLDDDIATGRIWAAPVAKGQMKKEGYFNSGVIYMNLEKIRRAGNMREAVVKYIEENPDTNLPDQDALNVIYQSQTLLLDPKWNRFAKYVRRDGEKELKDCIYHYVGSFCVLYYQTAMDALYIQTADHTPWKNELSGNYINMSVNRQQNRIDNLKKLISEISSGDKKMLFYGKETMGMKSMYRLLSVTDKNSYRILEQEDESGILPCKNPDALRNEQKGTYIVFVLPEADDGKAMSNLEMMGLKNQEDFYVIPCMLQQKDGGYLA